MDLAVFQVWEVAQVVFPTVVVLVVVLVVFLTLAVVPMAVSVVRVGVAMVVELVGGSLCNSNMMDKSGIVPSLPTLI